MNNPCGQSLWSILAIESKSQFNTKKNGPPLSNSTSFCAIERLKTVTGNPENSLEALHHQSFQGLFASPSSDFSPA
jgi:hypothetical protein